MECIILAGGLGTRLSGVVSDVPKCMAPVGDEPFLAYLLHYLELQAADHVILSLGYKSEVVVEYLRRKAFTFKTSWVLEKEPLGTGGGIKRALMKSKEQKVFVLNGDTMFRVPLREMAAAFPSGAKAMLALKPMRDSDRYGAVTLDAGGRIQGFEEKKFMPEGLINGGVYLFDKAKEDLSVFPESFSFEKDFLEVQPPGTLAGFVCDSYFIDIGIPEDYRRAQLELSL